MTPTLLCFGEVLWDCLPRGLFLGGAPCNVAYHLKQLNCEPVPVTAVGDDFLGEEILRRLRAWRIETRFVPAVPDWRTGAVRVELHQGVPRYEILPDAAWDHIPGSPALLEAAGRADALVFGTLALREPHNRAVLASLLEAARGLKVLDVNLRPPFVDRDPILGLAAQAGLVKLNDEELDFFIPGADGVGEKAARFARRVGGGQVCVTCGARGAGLWTGGAWHWTDSRPVAVQDTVGAGDAFLAGLLSGLLRGSETPERFLRRACDLAGFVAQRDGATPEYNGSAFLP